METKQVNFRMSVEKIEYLKKISREISVEKNRDEEYTDLIREAIDEKYFDKKEGCFHK